MNDFARSFTGFITLDGATSTICVHVWKGDNMLLVIFLFKQEIFSPDLPTKPVLIISVAWGGEGMGEASPIIFLSYFFAPNLFSPMC